MFSKHSVLSVRQDEERTEAKAVRKISEVTLNVFVGDKERIKIWGSPDDASLCAGSESSTAGSRKVSLLPGATLVDASQILGLVYGRPERGEQQLPLEDALSGKAKQLSHTPTRDKVRDRLPGEGRTTTHPSSPISVFSQGQGRSALFCSLLLSDRQLGPGRGPWSSSCVERVVLQVFFGISPEPA